MTTNKLPEAALFYAQRLDWAVFPLKPESKAPATAHGFKDASRDADTIRAWWQRTPNANIGLRTGDVFVLDFDAHKPDYNGAELLDMLLEDCPTATADTARGGVHLFFSLRPGLQLTNASGSLPRGVDGGEGGEVSAQLRTPIYQTGATKPIGYVVADELRVTVNGARHFLRRRPVLAFSERAIAKAEAAGATSIVVNDKETGKAYRVTLAALRVNGKQFDMGYEKRVGLHISQWDEVEAEEQLPLWA